MNELRPNKQRGKIAIVLIWIILVLNIMALLSGFFQYQLLERALAGENVSYEEANASFLRQSVLYILNAIAYIISIVTFLRWFRRAYYNLDAKLGNLDYTDGWAAGSWFVPVVNLYKPYQIMKELYTKTDLYLEFLNDERYTKKLSTSILPVWWVLWLGSRIAISLISDLSSDSSSLIELSDSTVFSLFGALLSILLCLITIIVIMDYNRAENLMYEIEQENQAAMSEEALSAIES